jgi:hypothetical protein
MDTRCFKDRFGKVWDLKLDLGTALMIDRSDFTIYTSHPVVLSRYDKDVITDILTNTPLLFAVIGVIVRDQFRDNLASRVNLDEATDKAAVEEAYQTAFVKSIDGSCLESARTAFVEALVDFFPAAKTVLCTFLQKIEEWETKMSSRLKTEVLPMLDARVDQMMDEEILRLKNLTEKSLPLSPSSVSPELNGSE